MKIYYVKYLFGKSFVLGDELDILESFESICVLKKKDG